MKKWTEARNVEAIARTFEIAAELWRADRIGAALGIAGAAVWDEACFRRALDAAGFDSERIEAEVKRLFALVAS